MSPEAIELPDGKRRLKVGRPSDVWSLGCIIYQMVYGHPPFQHLAVYHKMKAIPDARHIIDFPEYSTPSTPTKNGMRRGEPSQPQEHLKRRVPKAVIDCMKGCLVRNPKERATIPELLEQKWLTGDDSDEATAAEGENGKEKPTLASLLKPDQTIITPYYMRQLLMYGMSLGGANTDTVDEEALLVEAKVGGLFCWSRFLWDADAFFFDRIWSISSDRSLRRRSSSRGLVLLTLALLFSSLGRSEDRVERYDI